MGPVVKKTANIVFAVFWALQLRVIIPKVLGPIEGVFSTFIGGMA